MLSPRMKTSAWSSMVRGLVMKKKARVRWKNDRDVMIVREWMRAMMVEGWQQWPRGSVASFFLGGCLTGCKYRQVFSRKYVGVASEVYEYGCAQQRYQAKDKKRREEKEVMRPRRSLVCVACVLMRVRCTPEVSETKHKSVDVASYY